jgi:hypothetical protein
VNITTNHKNTAKQQTREAKRMIRQAGIVVLILSVLCVLLIGSVYAQGQWGVTQGDTFTYSMHGSFSSSGDQTNSQYFLPANDVEYYKITITDVSSTSLHTQETMHFKNGTEKIQTGYTDPEGSGNGMFSGYFTKTNLNINDEIHHGNLVMKVTETTTRSFPSGLREINHAVGEFGNQYHDFYYDKLTGVPVSFTLTQFFGDGKSQQGQIIAVLQDSSLWSVSESASPSPSDSLSPSPSIPEFSSTILIITFLIIATLLETVVIKRKQSRRILQ